MMSARCAMISATGAAIAFGRFGGGKSPIRATMVVKAIANPSTAKSRTSGGRGPCTDRLVQQAHVSRSMLSGLLALARADRMRAKGRRGVPCQGKLLS